MLKTPAVAAVIIVTEDKVKELEMSKSFLHMQKEDLDRKIFIKKLSKR